MIQVTIGDNLNRKKVNMDSDKTLREALEENEIDYSAATIHMDGCSVQPGDLDKTFEELGVTERCYLLAVTKTNNA